MKPEVMVARYTEISEAEIAKSLLIANGIPCWLSNDDGGGMYPQLHLGEGMRLMVPEQFSGAAKELLSAYESGSLDSTDESES
jgi:hypothetical protein